MLNGIQETMTLSDFDAKYPSELQEKYKLILKAIKAGNKEEGRELVATLSKEQKILFRQFQKDTLKVRKHCDDKVASLKAEKAAVITQFSRHAAQTYKDYTIPSSNSSSTSTQAKKSNGYR